MDPSYPKVYRIPQSTNQMITIIYAVFGVGASIVIGVYGYQQGLAPAIIGPVIVGLLAVIGLIAWASSRKADTTSVTLYDDHVEWINGRHTGSCSNHELTIKFGNRPQTNQGDGSGKDIRFVPDGGPYMWAWRDFENYPDLVSELQRRVRQ